MNTVGSGRNKEKKETPLYCRRIRNSFIFYRIVQLQKVGITAVYLLGFYVLLRKEIHFEIAVKWRNSNEKSYKREK
jgi:hypothetical protein